VEKPVFKEKLPVTDCRPSGVIAVLGFVFSSLALDGRPVAL